MIILTAVPYTIAALAQLGLGYSAQRHSELKYHTAVPYLVGGLFIALLPVLNDVSAVLAFLALAIALAT